MREGGRCDGPKGCWSLNFVMRRGGEEGRSTKGEKTRERGTGHPSPSGGCEGQKEEGEERTGQGKRCKGRRKSKEGRGC